MAEEESGGAGGGSIRGVERENWGEEREKGGGGVVGVWMVL